MGHELLDNIFTPLAIFGSMFGGISLVIWTATKAKIARIKAEAQARQMTAGSQPEAGVAAELKALRQQIAEMQNTGHQFDLSFDEALNRMEGRVNRLETKSVVTTTPSATDTTPNTLRNGQS